MEWSEGAVVDVVVNNTVKINRFYLFLFGTALETYNSLILESEIINIKQMPSG